VNKLPETTLAWLRQTAKFEGAVTAQALLHVLGRLEALEAAQQQPTPEAAPVATDNGLVRCYAQAVEDALKAGHGIDCAAAAALRAVYNLDRQHGAAQPPAAQPTPPAAPAGTAELAADCSALDARAWAYIGKQAMCGDPAATALIDLLNNPPAPQPTPPAAPAGGLVGRVEARAGGDGRAAIREMAAALLEWHHSDELVHTAWEAAKWLEQETDQ
jgi:uncharacterized protein (DUF1778 family)